MKSKIAPILFVIALVVVIGALVYSENGYQAPVPATPPNVVEVNPAAPTPKQESSTSTVRGNVPTPKPTPLPSEDMTASNIVILINNDRIANGLLPLRVSAELNVAAQAKANDEVARNYFAHLNPDGQMVWALIQQNGYQFKYAGENLAVNYDTVSSQNDGWMNSPVHRGNILKAEYTDVGVGIAVGNWNGKTNSKFVVTLFASK